MCKEITNLDCWWDTELFCVPMSQEYYNIIILVFLTIDKNKKHP